MKSELQKGLSVLCAVLIAGTGAVAQAQQSAPTQSLSPQQMDNLVAPIALYPDPLLGQVLAASTYPVEIVEAQQWLQANSGLDAQALADAARQQNWDASVQAMVTMPDVLGKLNQDIRWTTDLGNAFLAQQADVMAAVQRLRASAEANGKLQSTPQETVTTQTQDGQQAIEIAPADPQVIYVPNYDPSYIWGPPVYGYYPALYYPAFGFGWYPGFHVGLFYSGWAGWGGWGWRPNWFGGGVVVNAGFFNHYGYRYASGFGYRGTAAWVHDPVHRVGVGYGNAALTNRFGAASQAARTPSAPAANYHSFGAPGGTYRAPAQHYSAPAASHMSAPAGGHSVGGGSHGGGHGRR